MQRYNIIGDIHGRTKWRMLVVDDATNIFVGDYFDSYSFISFDDMKTNFVAIKEYCSEHGGIMLMGNHDLHYFHYEETSRMDIDNKDEIRELLSSIVSEKSIAYAINERIICSHAGFTDPWVMVESATRSEYRLNDTADAYQLATFANELFCKQYYDMSNGKMGEMLPSFQFRNHARQYDSYGISPAHSPVWVRPEALSKYAFNKQNITQIVGHTQQCGIRRVAFATYETESELILVDCLEQNAAQSLLITLNDDGTTEVEINNMY